MHDAGEFIAHYASQYYDPAKAKAYYERTKELKGRQSTKGMSETQRQALGYAKNQIGESKKAELKSSQESQKAQMENLRARAKESRERIKQKLEKLLEEIKAKREAASKLELNKIPKNATPEQRAFLEKQNAAYRQRNERKASEEAAKATEAAREGVRKEAEKLGAELKSAVTNARESYKAAREQINTKYENAQQTEYDNIKTQLPGEPAKAAATPKKTRKERKKT